MAAPRLYLDVETRSELDLKRVGAHNYFEHRSTSLWCAAYAFDDGPVELWKEGDKIPEDVRKHIHSGGEIWAHNAAFERQALLHAFGWPSPVSAQMRCTMCMCLAMSLPGSLENAAGALGIEAKKDMEGRRLMLQLCKPRSTDPTRWWDDPAKLARLYEYCRNDVVVEREISRRVLQLSERESELWVLDQEINDRGVEIDIEAVKWAIRIAAGEEKRLNGCMSILTDGNVSTCNASVALAKYLGVDSVDKASVAELLAKPDLRADHRKLLELRQEAAKSSVGKLEAMRDRGPRARGLFQFAGANTGRWAGRAIQPQNMPRGTLGMTPGDVDQVLSQKSARAALDLMYGPPLSVLSDCLRGFLISKPGYELVGCDFSAIEARVLAWLAGENRVVDRFARGDDVYVHQAAGIYHIEPEAVTKQQRFVGKVATLALGYQGSVGAFSRMAENYGLRVTEQEARPIVDGYRAANPAIVRYWADLDKAAQEAVLSPGKIRYPGPDRKGVAFVVRGSFLWLRLPSGRALCYPYPKLRPGKFGRDVISYMSTELAHWVRCDTYGGSLAENVTQAVARDLLAEAMMRCPWPVVLHVHDEIVVEVPEGTLSVTDMEAKMSELPSWADGLPIAAEGWAGRRYRK